MIRSAEVTTASREIRGRNLEPRHSVRVPLRIHTVLFLGLTGAIVFFAGRPTVGSDDTQNAVGGDNVCGPRCVQFLLRYYGKEEPELINLVRSMQWPDIEQGSTFECINNTLRKTGIYTLPVHINTDVKLCWSAPVVVHLKAQEGVPEHYVVWLPSAGPGAEVWDGLRGAGPVDEKKFADLRSGNVLLTAAQPITDAGSAFRLRRSSRRFRLSIISVLVVGLLLASWKLVNNQGGKAK